MRKLFLQPHQRYRLLLVLGDLLIIMGSLSLMFFLEAFGRMPLQWGLSRIFAIYFMICGVMICIYYILDLYNLAEPKGSGITFLSICLGMGIVMTLNGSLSYFLIYLRPGKINLLLFILVPGILTFAWHISFSKLVKIKPQRLLFIGKEKIFDEISNHIDDNYSQYYTIVGRWHQHSHNPSLPNLFDFIEDNRADLIVYSVHSKMLKQIANDLVTLKFRYKNVIDSYNFYQRLTWKFPIYFQDEFWLLVNAQKEVFFPSTASNLKRAVDLFLVLLLLPVAVPLLLVAALAIKLDSRGPVFFIQERLGQNEVPFRLYKLRTMIDNAESLTGPQWSAAGDARITRVGRILRKMRLDELPQLFHVLKGEMSLVGPRPIRRHFADILDKEIPFYRLRFLAKPGLTGWSQVNHDYAGSQEGQSEKLQYELFYLAHQSIRLDLLILFKTIKVMIWGKGT